LPSRFGNLKASARARSNCSYLARAPAFKAIALALPLRRSLASCFFLQITQFFSPAWSNPVLAGDVVLIFFQCLCFDLAKLHDLARSPGASSSSWVSCCSTSIRADVDWPALHQWWRKPRWLFGQEAVPDY